MSNKPTINYINAITLGQTTIVGLVDDIDYIVGEYVSFRVSKDWGTVEINNQRGLILAIGSTDITVQIDSTNYTPFVYSPSSLSSPAITVPAGSGIPPNSNPKTVTLEDCFDNVPPN